jgi:DNA adenine methylase
MKNTELDYYRVRQTQPQTTAEQAARLIYLVTLSFNGIYRENSRGMFNVPYGHKTHLDPCNSERILASSMVLSHAQLIQGDFADAINQAEKGDLVYLDPPYTVAHGNNGFVKYNARMFSWDDQKRLSAWALELDRRGCRVIVSNAAHPSIAALYENFEVGIVRL